MMLRCIAGGAESVIDASPGEDGILGSRERSTRGCRLRIYIRVFPKRAGFRLISLGFFSFCRV
jgi:hypothetical protein